MTQKFYAHQNVKRLPAEVLLDAIDFACGTHEKFPDVPLGIRAIELPDSNFESYFQNSESPQDHAPMPICGSTSGAVAGVWVCRVPFFAPANLRDWMNGCGLALAAAAAFCSSFFAFAASKGPTGLPRGRQSAS